jgi:DNA-binding NarL/FixJ family response regulator
VALEAGILGYVLKFNAGEDLIPAISHALKGETFVSSPIASKT